MKDWKIPLIMFGALIVAIGLTVWTGFYNRAVENRGIKRYTGVYRVAQVDGKAYIIQAEMTNGNRERWWEFQGREKTQRDAEAMMRMSVQWFMEYAEKEKARRAIVTNVVIEIDVSSAAL